MYIIEYDNCEAFEDNRTWHSNKVFETKMQAIRFLIIERLKWWFYKEELLWMIKLKILVI